MDTEKPNRKILVDVDAGERYLYVAGIGRRIFEDHQSAVLEKNRDKPLTAADLIYIAEYHAEAAPDNPLNPWRLQKPFEDDPAKWAEERLRSGLIADPSYFDNWSKPGGPAEHIELATEVSLAGQDFLTERLRDLSLINDEWVSGAIEALRQSNKYKVAAAVAMHDDGRFVTHTFSNGPIGFQLLRKIGVKPEITKIIPSETSYFKVPFNEEVFPVIQKLPVEMILVALADNFGKWSSTLRRLPLPVDFTPENMQAWADGYAKRPFSGRPSDMAARKDLPLHVANEKRVFDAFDKWVRLLTTTNLEEYAQAMNDRFASQFIT